LSAFLDCPMLAYGNPVMAIHIGSHGDTMRSQPACEQKSRLGDLTLE